MTVVWYHGTFFLPKSRLVCQQLEVCSMGLLQYKVPIAATLLLAGSITGVLLADHYHKQYGPPPRAYAVVVDAGSSHTDVSFHPLLSFFSYRCIVCLVISL